MENFPQKSTRKARRNSNITIQRMRMRRTHNASNEDTLTLNDTSGQMCPLITRFVLRNSVSNLKREGKNLKKKNNFQFQSPFIQAAFDIRNYSSVQGCRYPHNVDGPARGGMRYRACSAPLGPAAQPHRGCVRLHNCSGESGLANASIHGPQSARTAIQYIPCPPRPARRRVNRCLQFLYCLAGDRR